jgi:5'-phosphate synthase pdxT subunit
VVELKIGVLALQGAVSEHIESFSTLGVEAIPVRLPLELNGLKALVIPGGESTTISRLMSDFAILGTVRELASQGFPILGTCAGLILLAKKVAGFKLDTIAAMDIEVRRNAYGRQVNSFEADLDIFVLGNNPFPGVFIRAPIIERVGDGVEILCRLDGVPVAVQQGKMLACSFHPELAGDLRFHKYFLDLVMKE